jgi:hypothetical protein
VWGPLAIVGILWLSAMNHAASIDAWLEGGQTKLGIKTPLTFTTVMDPVLAAIGWCVGLLDTALQWIFHLIQMGGVATPNFHLSLKVTTAEYRDNLIAQAIAYVMVLFLICMVCHGELVKSKPQPRHLTMYFLMISAGGALGGLFVAMICPLIFQSFFELPLCIMLGFLVAWIALANDGRETWLKGQDMLQWAAAFMVVGSTLLVAKANYESIDEEAVAVVRNFYGVLAVKRLDQDDPAESGRALYHGRILHGFQFDDPARELLPNTYYVPTCGVGLAAEQYPREPGKGMKVGVIGLGTGTMSTHGISGDHYRFYDIDPKVVAISDQYFTYRKKTPPTKEIILGDARIKLEREPPQNYDLIVLDAFSGDAIPAHLLTAEAFAQYLRHLKRKDPQSDPTGIIAVHISNRYIDLEPVVAALARKYAIPAKVFHVEEGENGGGNGDTGSDWILVSHNQEFWNNPTVAALAQPLAVARDKELLWTDQRSSLWPILK